MPSFYLKLYTFVKKYIVTDLTNLIIYISHKARHTYPFTSAWGAMNLLEGRDFLCAHLQALLVKLDLLCIVEMLDSYIYVEIVLSCPLD